MPRFACRPPFAAALAASAALFAAVAVAQTGPARTGPPPADFAAAPPPRGDEAFGSDAGDVQPADDFGTGGDGRNVFGDVDLNPTTAPREEPVPGWADVPPAAFGNPAAAAADGDPYADGSAAEEPADGPPEVPGATSVEPVLRAVYRPHPTRVRAVYEFLKSHAAAGIDVTVRPSAGADGDGGDDAEQGGEELVVVAPAETQRALGAFLQLCVSPAPAPEPAARPTGAPTPAGGGFDPPRGYRDPEPEAFDAPARADFGAAFTPRPDAGDDFGTVAADVFDDDGFGESPDAFDAGFGDAFSDPDNFGTDPARTTRKVPPAE